MLDVIAKQGSACIRLVIVDRQPIVLQGLKSVFGAQQDFDVVASSSDGASCLEAIRNLKPDVALLADTLPDLTVSELLAIAKAEKLPTRLVFFAESDTDHDLTAAIAAGACSVISKFASPDTMLQSLRLMTKRFVAPEQSYPWPTGKEADAGKIEKMLAQLTQRERQIARLVSEGKSNKEIARQLDVSQGTVKVHLYNIFQKLEITNRTVLATISLLQRTSGFGTLALAFLALAIADELKAAEANDMLPDDDSIGHAGEHAEYEPWKKAILRHRIAWESSETPPLTQRDLFAKLGQVTNPAAAIEALRAAEQSVGSKLWKDYGPVGSSTPNLPALLPRGTSDTQIGGDPAPDHLVPRLASNPMSLQGGYGTFATLAGALIYALHDPHLAAQAHEAGKASIDSFAVVTGENATTKVAGITDAGAHHAGNSAPAFPSHDAHLPSAFVSTGDESVAGEGARSQMAQGAVGDAAGDNLQKTPGLVDSGYDAGIGGDRSDQPMGGNVDENVAHRSQIDSKSTSSDLVSDLASGSGRINLAAFGALAWLHMTAASKSIPPHTLAWIYNAASNETIVYVNATDRSLDIGDHGLLEIHLQGIVSIAESDVIGQPESAAVAITLEQLEEALKSALATDEAVLSTDNVHAIGGAGEGTVETAGIWNILADDGSRFQFGQTRTGLGASTRFRSFNSDPTDATEESDGASAVSAHASSTGLVHSVTVTAAENLTLKGEPINAGTGISSTGLNEIVGPSVAAADSASHGNSEHASEHESAKEAAAESNEADSKPGNGVGNDNANDGSQGAAKKAEKAESSGAEPGKSEHANSADAAATESNEADSKPGNGAGSDNAHDGSQGAAKKAENAESSGAEPGKSEYANSADAAATESNEADSKPGNGAGSDNAHDGSQGAAKKAENAESSGAEPGKSEYANSADAAATESNEADSKPGNGAGSDNAHDGSQGAAKKAENAESSGAEPGKSEHASSANAAATASTEADSKPGNGVGNDKKMAEAADEDHGNSGHDSQPTPASGPKAADVAEAAVATADSASHGNSDRAAEPAPVKEAAAEPAEADANPGNAVGHDKKTAEAADEDHGNSAHDPDSANGPKAAEIAEAAVAMADSASHGNSDCAAEPGPAKEAAAELTEADSTSGNGGGNDNAQHAPASDAASAPAAVQTAEAADVDHGNSGHDLPSTSANAPDAAGTVEPSVAAADSESHGNSDHASEPGSAKTAATELADADSTPGNGVGNDKTTAEVADADHGNSGHDSQSASVNAPDATEIVEPSVASGDNAGHGNSQQVVQPAAIASEAAQPAQAAPETGGADQDLVFRFDGEATPSTPVAVVVPPVLDSPPDTHVPPGQDKHLEIIVQIMSSTLDDHATNHGNSGSHPATGHAAHDLLI
ncbi:LuxR C-terminal-related transcriptional regulator [Bradyrhizobium iriomotense]|uniref:LuxR C-terminal-related transcriptional regulator n=1 Tax=Bradyrhizobium iriomotense TaxID=441950 RepID=UPI001B8A3606|nr:LuxR C-terminal-related transcriptional regulator [Bradyrhizobium iriomotense]MBR0783619.1 response regulator [Bradyrhizobium iriomotense]